MSPFGPSDTIRTALLTLMKTGAAKNQSGGFVIFDLGEDTSFVQFSLEPEGLMLFWPEQAGPSDDVEKLLGEREFADTPDEPGLLKPSSYTRADDGLYAQFGRDLAAVEQFTLEVFGEVFRASSLAMLRATVDT